MLVSWYNNNIYIKDRTAHEDLEEESIIYNFINTLQEIIFSTWTMTFELHRFVSKHESKKKDVLPASSYRSSKAAVSMLSSNANSLVSALGSLSGLGTIMSGSNNQKLEGKKKLKRKQIQRQWSGTRTKLIKWSQKKKITREKLYRCYMVEKILYSKRKFRKKKLYDED